MRCEFGPMWLTSATALRRAPSPAKPGVVSICGRRMGHFTCAPPRWLYAIPGVWRVMRRLPHRAISSPGFYNRLIADRAPSAAARARPSAPWLSGRGYPERAAVVESPTNRLHATRSIIGHATGRLLHAYL